MINLQVVSFLDVFPCLGLLRSKAEKAVAAFDGPCSRLELRDKNGKETEHLQGKEPWRGGMKVLNSARKIVAKLPLMTDSYGACCLEVMPPGKYTEWLTLSGEYHSEHERFILPLSTNPASGIYAGTELFIPAVGSLTWLSNKAPHTMVNFGETNRLWLVMDFLKAETG